MIAQTDTWQPLPVIATLPETANGIISIKRLRKLTDRRIHLPRLFTGKGTLLRRLLNTQIDFEERRSSQIFAAKNR